MGLATELRGAGRRDIDYGFRQLAHDMCVGSPAPRGRSWFVRGSLARMLYGSLHLMHHNAVLGGVRTAVMAMGRFLIKRSTPQVKLH